MQIFTYSKLKDEIIWEKEIKETENDKIIKGVDKSVWCHYKEGGVF